MVSLFAPHAVTDDRLIAAYRTLSRISFPDCYRADPVQTLKLQHWPV
jgi:hypothetical protein